MTHLRFERRAIVQICKNASAEGGVPPPHFPDLEGWCFVQMRLFASSNPVYAKSNRYGMASTGWSERRLIGLFAGGAAGWGGDEGVNGKSGCFLTCG
jgi:hypothetical protein